MPKKIENLLTAGLPAHIYLLCYVKLQTGYSIGQKIYGIEKGIPPTSKIYPWIKQMIKDGYLVKTKDGFTARIEPFLSQIKNEIQKINPLSKDEETKLVQLLNSSEFKKYILGWYERGRKIGSYGWSGTILPYNEEQFNALKLISETIGMLCTVSIIKTEFTKTPLGEDEQKMEKYYRSRKEPESWIQEQIKGIRQYNAVVVHMKNFSHELLSKLAKLWSASDFIIRTEIVMYKQKYMNSESVGGRK